MKTMSSVGGGALVRKILTDDNPSLLRGHACPGKFGPLEHV